MKKLSMYGIIFIGFFQNAFLLTYDEEYKAYLIRCRKRNVDFSIIEKALKACHNPYKRSSVPGNVFEGVRCTRLKAYYQIPPWNKSKIIALWCGMKQDVDKLFIKNVNDRIF